MAWLLQWQEVKTDPQDVLQLLHLLCDTWIAHTHSHTDRHGFRESSLEKNLFKFLVFKLHTKNTARDITIHDHCPFLSGHYTNRLTGKKSPFNSCSFLESY